MPSPKAIAKHVFKFVWNCLMCSSLCDMPKCIFCRRKFRSQTSDNMDRWKAEMGRVRDKRRVEERRSEKRKNQKKEDADAPKGRKVAKHYVFPMICGSGGSKVGSLKRRVRSHLARWEMKNCTPFWREAHFEVKTYKTHQLRITFGSWDVEKVHAVVAYFEVKTYKTHELRTTFGNWDV